MKNPLMRRLPRELTGDIGKYAVIFLFMTLTIGFISGFLVAGGSMIHAYNESFEKYNIEYGHFVFEKEAPKSLLARSEEKGVQIVPDFYREETADHNGDGVTDSTIRIYGERSAMNRVCLMEGALPEGENEIAVDRMFADNNGIHTGDVVRVGGHDLEVTGFVALPDYSALFSDNNDIMFDAVKFGVAVMTEKGCGQFSRDKIVYSYSWDYDSEPADDMAEKKVSEDFLESLAKEAAATGLEIRDFVPRFTNQAIQFTGNDMGSDRTMMTVLLYILIAILAFVFSVTIRHTIFSESSVIGTLRASGYTKGEIVRHYMAVPMTVTTCSALAGNILGYTFFKDLVADMYYGSYSLPTYRTVWNGEAFVLTTAVPFLIMLATNIISLARTLRCTPLQFLRRDLAYRPARVKSGSGKQKFGNGGTKVSFFTRFRFRIITQNFAGFLTLFAGIIFSCILLLFGMMMTPLLSHYKDNILNDMLAEYQYVLAAPAGTKNESAEKYCMTSLNYEGSMRDEEISIYGIEKNSRYVEIKMHENEVCLSDGFALKYGIKQGDDITLKEKYGTKKYTFHVGALVKYAAGLAVFMDRDSFNDTFHAKLDYFDVALTDPGLTVRRLLSIEDTKYFTGYLCDQKITDIDEKYIEACITADDMTKLSRQLDVSMGSWFYMINVFAVFMAALLIYLLTKLILEKNSNAISMLKILGYENGEIAKLYLVATTCAVVVFLCLGMLISVWFISAIYRMFMMGFNGWLDCYFAPVIFPQMFVMVMAAYGVVAYLQMRKIRSIPMEEALKHVE